MQINKKLYLSGIQKQEPSTEAVIDPVHERRVTYEALQRMVEETSKYLIDEGKRLIFCFCKNDLPSIVTYLASVEAGHAVALLDVGTRSKLKRRLIELYKPEWIAGPAELAEELGNEIEWRQESSCKDGLLLWRSCGEKQIPPHPELTVLLSTSGSTGSPKFVRLSRRNLESNASSIAAALGINNSERAITSLPFHYSYGLSLINSHLITGASLVVCDSSVIERSFWKIFSEQGCTSFAGVPYTYQMLKRIGFFGFDLPSLRHMTQAGGKLDTATILEFHRVLANHNQQFHVMYGQTEATARISCLPPKDLPRKAGSVGFAIPGGKIDIRSEKGDNLGPCVTGEVVYTGPNVMMGYAICREDLSRGDEHGGVLYTSDIGYLDREGYLYITGRNKRIAKVFGKRVNLDEVEDRLLRYGPTAAVSGEDKIILYCEHGSPEALKRYKKELVEEFTLHPTSFVIRRIDKLPTTPRGKVSYKELEEWD